MFRRKPISLLFGSILCLSVSHLLADTSAQLQPIEFFVLDPDATGYATFQSHNQKVARSENQLFTTHIRSRNDDYTAQQWRLSLSRDSGKSFETVLEDTHATNPPPIEIDSDGNLYLARVDWVGGDAYLYRFARENPSPAITKIPGGAAGKFCLCLDEPRKQLYFFSHNNTFHVVGMDGHLKSSVQLLQPGPHGLLQYPLLALAQDGSLVAGWTTQTHGVYMYRSIHAMRSPDGGQTWTTLAGQPLTLPVIADETGPADLLSSRDDLEVHTWLSNLLVHDGKLHCMYLAQSTPPREHYLRYDLATGQRDLHHTPFVGDPDLRIESLDGFFATDGKRLFAVGVHQNRVVSIASDDLGRSWRDHAAGNPFSKPIYAIGGNRATSPDGFIEGTFTEMTGDPPSTQAGAPAKVHFFRIPVGK